MTTVSVDMQETSYHVASSGSNVRMNGNGSQLTFVIVAWPIGSAASTYDSVNKSAMIYVTQSEFQQLCASLLSGTVEVILFYDDAQSGTVKTVTGHQFLPSQHLLARHAMERMQQRVAVMEESFVKVERALTALKNSGSHANGPQ
jgi:hypothetical protein